MKKKFLCLVAVVAITGTAAWNVSQSKNEMVLTDVALENVEALAYDLPEVTITCSGGGCGQCYSGSLVFSGEFTYYQCRATGNPSNYCPC